MNEHQKEDQGLMKNNENRWVDLSNGVAWAIIFSLAAIIMSIIALSTRYPRTDLSLDYMGVIVGILALLVTALIGWQIFNLIKIDRLKESLENAEQKAIEVRHDLTQQINRHIAQSSMINVVHFAKNIDGNKNDYVTLTLMYGLSLQALYSQLETGTIEYANTCITAMAVCLKCANSSGEWDIIFNKKTIDAAKKTYKLVLSQSHLFTTEQIDNLMLIHKCRVGKTFDESLLPFITNSM